MRHSWILPALPLLGSIASGADNRSVRLRVDYSSKGRVRLPRFSASPGMTGALHCSRIPLPSDTPASVDVAAVSGVYPGDNAASRRCVETFFMTSQENVLYNYTWTHGHLTSEGGIIYEVMMYCYSEHGHHLHR
jgi:hypothetical protein